MYAVKRYCKAVHFYMRKVSYRNVFRRGQPRKVLIFFMRLILCTIFFPRGRSDTFVFLHEIDLVKKYMDLFLCEIDLVQKQNFTISGINRRVRSLHTRVISTKCYPLLHEKSIRQSIFFTRTTSYSNFTKKKFSFHICDKILCHPPK